VVPAAGGVVRIDRADGDDEQADAAEARTPDAGRLPDATRSPDAGRPADASPASDDSRTAEGRDPRNPPDAASRIALAVEYRAKVAAVDRAHAIDQGHARVSELERGTVTPALQRIEAEDPDRHLAGLEHRLKGKDRLAEKVSEAMTERSRTADQAFATVKDAIRYTFCYAEGDYTEGVYTDFQRLEESGFQPVERRNSWEHEEYKGINSRWRVPDDGQLFEVQFHTQASFKAKQETHWAYEKLRDPATSRAEQEAAHAYQREVTARIPIPPGARDIPNYSER
jgi:hypothetical protein